MNHAKRLFLLCVMAGVLGCQVQRANLIESGEIVVEVLPSDHVQVRGVRAYQETSGVTVTGLLEHQDNDSAAIKVHVDVTLLSAARDILAEAVSVPVFLPTERTAHVSHAKPFSVLFDVDLPDRAIVRIKVHYFEHKPSTP